jgi:hypothetical protein
MKMGNFDIRVRGTIGDPKQPAFVTITNPDGSGVKADCESMPQALHQAAAYCELLALEIEKQLTTSAILLPAGTPVTAQEGA